MEYSIQRLSNLAGISTRTLRYYNEIGLLNPSRISSSGYRIYGEIEVKKLQQILFYKELGVSLHEIKDIINNPKFNIAEALESHHEKLMEERQRLDLLIKNVEKTIANTKGEIEMADKEKFNGFKKDLIEKNEKKYGKEVRDKYGDDTVNKSNKKFANISKEDFDKFNLLAEEINTKLLDAMDTNDASSELSQEVAKLHKEWLCFTWPKYSKEAHAGLAEMYVADERFTAYYDKLRPGATKFLRDVILVFTGNK